MTTPQTLTELMSRVDWSQMRVDRFRNVRHRRNNTCPLIDAAGGTVGDLNIQAEHVAAALLGLDKHQAWTIIHASDETFHSPAVRRWRQYFLEQIHTSQTVTEQP